MSLKYCHWKLNFPKIRGFLQICIWGYQLQEKCSKEFTLSEKTTKFICNSVVVGQSTPIHGLQPCDIKILRFWTDWNMKNTVQSTLRTTNHIVGVTFFFQGCSSIVTSQWGILRLFPLHRQKFIMRRFHDLLHQKWGISDSVMFLHWWCTVHRNCFVKWAIECSDGNFNTISHRRVSCTLLNCKH